jgi:hypothetical protein
VLRFLLIFALAGASFASSLADSAATLGQKVLTHLAPDEVASVTWHGGAALEVKAAFARALQRQVRSPKPVEIRAYLSENFRGPLLIAEIVRDTGNIVEMVPASRARDASAALSLKLSLVWEQVPQILDLAFLNDQMLVLDVTGLSRYRRQDGQWRPIEMSSGMPTSVRDPRGHIDVTRNPPVFYLPGWACSKPDETTIQCEPGGIITAGRNTLSEEAWPAHYAHVVLAGEHLLAEVDGRTHVYDAGRAALGSFDGWSSDFALVFSPCGGEKILASEAATDAVALYAISNQQPVRMSDLVALPGPVTAVWPQGTGATVVAKNSKTGRYEAYSASMDCRN